MNIKDVDSSVAIDPLALILPNRLFLIYMEIRHPRTPISETLSEVFREMTPPEKETIIRRAMALSEMAKTAKELANRERERVPSPR